MFQNGDCFYFGWFSGDHTQAIKFLDFKITAKLLFTRFEIWYTKSWNHKCKKVEFVDEVGTLKSFEMAVFIILRDNDKTYEVSSTFTHNFIN